VKVILDESVPRTLAGLLEGHEVTTVPLRGWRSKENGELLGLASDEFDVFVTADQNLRYQQNLSGFDLGVVVLAAPQNRIESYLPMLEAIQQAIARVRPGTAILFAS